MRKDFSRRVCRLFALALSVTIVATCYSSLRAQTPEAYIRLSISNVSENEIWVDVQIRRDEGLTLDSLGSAVVDVYFNYDRLQYVSTALGDLDNFVTLVQGPWLNNTGYYVRFQAWAPGEIPQVYVGTQWQLLVQHRFDTGPPAEAKDFRIRSGSLHLGFVEDFKARIVRSVTVQIEPTVVNEQGIKSASEPGSEIPFVFALGENYPNPLNNRSQISFSVGNQTNVRISVFDMLGRELNVVVDQVMGPGIHAATVDAENLRSGTYLLVMQAGAFRKTRKITVSK